MPVTPQQTIVDTSADPSLNYIRNRDINTLIAGGGSQSTSTDREVINNVVENVTQRVTKVVETNVLADWNATSGTGLILNKPTNLATTTYVDNAIANVSSGGGNGNGIVDGTLTFSGGVITGPEFGVGLGMFGVAPTSDTDAGDIYLQGGFDLSEAGGPTTRGGAVSISAGQGANDVDASHGGSVEIYAGPASQTGGDIRIESGSTYSASGQAGEILIQSGSSVSGYGGNITIQSGVGTEGMQVFEGAVKMRGANVELISSFESFKVKTGDVDSQDGGPNVWEFDNAGVLKLPPGGDIVDSNGQTVLGGGGGSSGGSLSSRITVNATTSSLANNATGNLTISGAPSYMLMKVQTSAAAWVRIYTSSTARTADATRDILTDPAPGSGVLGEFITTASQTVVVTPAILGFTDNDPVSSDIRLAVTNKSGSTASITVTLTLLQLEA